MNLEKLSIFQGIKNHIQDFHNRSKKIQLIFYICIFLFIILISYFFIYSKISASIRLNSVRIFNAQHRYSNYLQSVSQIKYLKKQSQKYEDYISDFLEKVSFNDISLHIIDNLSLIATNNGLKVYTINKINNSNNANAYKSLNEISYAINVQGPYDGILKFAYNITQLNKLVILDDFNIKVIDDNNVSLSAIVKIYEHNSK